MTDPIRAVHGLVIALAILLAALSAHAEPAPRATGDLGVVIERASGSLLIVDRGERAVLDRVTGLGDVSHASVVYSPDERFAYVFGRDGGLTKVDMLTGEIAARTVQAGNAIGGAISQDGRLIAVSNYEPGGVKVFDAETLAPVADIPATHGPDGARAKVVGLVDAPGQRFVFSLYEGDAIWVADLSDPDAPAVRKFDDIGDRPYDALITPDGRYYLAGLYGEDGVALLDLWNLEAGVTRILDGYGRGHEDRPVYKMPHLEGWAEAGGDLMFLPAVGQHALLVVDTDTWRQVDRIATRGQPVFAVARPDGRQVWVTFAHPDNDAVQVVDVPSRRIVDTLSPGKAVLHLAFAPRGHEVWLSARDSDAVRVYDTATREPLATLPAQAPSGIFFTARAHKTGL